MKKTALLLISMGSLLLASCAGRESDSLLSELDDALSHAATYEDYFLQRVSLMRQLLQGENAPRQRYNINRRIAQEFMTYSLDSTMRYLGDNREIALSLHDPYLLEETDLLRAAEYAKAGYQSDALDVFSTYHADAIPEGLEALYYSTGNILYGEIAAYSNNPEYWTLQGQCRDALLPYLEEGTYPYYNWQRMDAEKQHRDSLARTYAEKMLEQSPLHSHEYAEASFFLSTYQDDPDEERRLLIRSAIADVMTATKDYASLNELALRLYRSGDIERAFRYAADYGMRDAIFFGGKLRPWQIAQFFPDVEKAYAERAEAAARRTAFLFALGAVLLLLLLLMLSIVVGRERALRRTRAELVDSKARVERRNASLEEVNARLRMLNDQLQESSKVRQEYIALFLETLSENITATRQYKNHVLKYIRMGNHRFLLDEIEALPPIDEDIQAFYKMFDKTFCNLYPDFVERFNELLQEGETLLPKGEDLLSPELRVFALIKLGISDSSRIASLLHYSANTIYNYRAKVKNKARGSREDFEAQVQGIE